MSLQEEVPKKCFSLTCTKPASTLKCPTCLQLNMPSAYFCSQECFKSNWTEHNKLHKYEREKIKRQEGLKDFIVPKFKYTGALRPSYITPIRTVPDNINKPDYYIDGIPKAEQRENALNRIPIYNQQDINGIRNACKLGRKVLDYASRLVKVGITTDEIDYLVHEYCIENNCYPSPLNYRGFPKSCCTSINEIVCHGIPDCTVLKEGDIINIDITVYKDGYHGDLNETYIVGDINRCDVTSKNLIKTTYFSMMHAIDYIKPDVFCKKFGEIIENYVKKNNFSVVKSYCGHGIGKVFHCNPNIPHYKNNKAIGKLKPGMIFTVEPMINVGTWKDITWPDGWTSATADGQRSAQFEHTVLVTDNGFEILTARTPESLPFWWESVAQ